MAIDKQQLLIELKAKGITLTKSQLKQLDGQVKASRAGMIAMGAGIATATIALAAMAKTLSHSIRVGKEFEQSMQNLKAISKASGAEMLKLETTARKLGASTKFTASQVGSLQTEFAKLGFTVKEIEKVTSATLSLAAATGSDLSTSAAVAGQTLRAFGMDAKDTHIITDTMAQSFSKSALDMQKFTDSMSYVAPVAKMAGFEVKGTTAMLGALANAGISGSMAGTALRRIFLELSNENSKLSKRLGGSVSSIEELIPALERLKEEGVSTAEMKDLVGLRATSAFNILLEGTDTLDGLTESLKNAGGAAKEMADIQLDSLEGKMTILNSAWEGLGVAIFDHFEEPLKSATDGLTSFLQSMTSVIESPMSESLENQRIRMNALFYIIQDSTKAEEDRKFAIDTLNKEYNKYLPNLLTEETSLNDIAKAQDTANRKLMDGIILRAQEEKLLSVTKEHEDLILKRRDAQLAESEASVKANEALQKFNEKTGQSFQSLGEYQAWFTQQSMERAKNDKEEFPNIYDYFTKEEILVNKLATSYRTKNLELGKSNIEFEAYKKELNDVTAAYNGLLDALGGSNLSDSGTPGTKNDGPKEGPPEAPTVTTPLVTPAEAEALFTELIEIENGYNENRLSAELDMYTKRMELLHDFVDQEYGATEEAEIKKAAITEKYEKKKRQAAFQSFSAGIGMMSSHLNAAAEAGMVSQKTAKKVAVVNTLIKTYESATNAFNAMAGIPVVGPALGTAAAAAAVASGLAQVETIKSQSVETPEAANVEKYIASGKAAAKAAEGGLIGGKPHSLGGTMIEAERGEFIVKKSAVDKIGVGLLHQLNNSKQNLPTNSFKYQDGGIVDTGIEPEFNESTAPVNISFEGNVLSRDFVETEVIEVLQNFVRRGGEI